MTFVLEPRFNLIPEVSLMCFISEYLSSDPHRSTGLACRIETDVETFFRTNAAEHQGKPAFSSCDSKRIDIDTVRYHRPQPRCRAATFLRLRHAMDMSVATGICPDFARIPLWR